MTTLLQQSSEIGSYMSGWFWGDCHFQAKNVSVAADRYTIVSPTIFQVEVGGLSLSNTAAQELDLSKSATWDTTNPTNYTTASNRAGLDFYVYACQPVTGKIPILLVSRDSSYPNGYGVNNSRKVAGFHCFCVSMSVPPEWDNDTAYGYGATVVPTAAAIISTPALANYWYRCIDDGTSDATTEPTWNQVVGASPPADGTVTWICEHKHFLADYVAGDILPNSVWDLRWRSGAQDGSGNLSNVGQVYDPKKQLWCAIYHPSGTLAAPTILYGGTILKNIDTNTTNVDWNNCVDACAVLCMRLPRDSEFQSIAEGSNALTTIYESTALTTALGSVDSTGRRMVSNIGVEGLCGQYWIWLDEQSYKFSDTTHGHTHNWVVTGEAQTDVVSGVASADLAPAFGWLALSGNKGSIYAQGTANVGGDVKLLAGGDYEGKSFDTLVSAVTNCGPRARDGSASRWSYGTRVTFRPVARHIVKEYI